MGGAEEEKKDCHPRSDSNQIHLEADKQRWGPQRRNLESLEGASQFLFGELGFLIGAPKGGVLQEVPAKRCLAKAVQGPREGIYGSAAHVQQVHENEVQASDI